MNILYVASEARPFIASGGLADVAGALPKQLCKDGHDARVVLPLYSLIDPKLREGLREICNFYVSVGWRSVYCGVLEGKIDGVTYYLLDNEDYFKRSFPDGIYGEYDKCEQFAFFSRAVLEMISHIDWQPQVINCNDWQTALVPVYLQLFYKGQPLFENIKSVFTIHNIAYQGQFGFEVLDNIVGIPVYYTGLMTFDGCVNLMKAAFETADKITTVSLSYAREIVDSDVLSYGLNRLLATKQYKLTGFVNGIDVEELNPETDKLIAKNYSKDDISGKRECKKALLSETGLTDGDEPLIGMVGRFSIDKGHKLIKEVFDQMVADGCKFAILGTGEKEYENFYRDMAARYPGKVFAGIRFDNGLARRIYAGADMFLMPSLSEPCGLAQLISLRYGTIPIVHEVGGLKDTIKEGLEGGNGFVFNITTSEELQKAVRRAHELYGDRENWEKLMKYDMTIDNSWGKSAELYEGLYKELAG
ncbi:MAG: glycogen synthase [Ruminococcus sp.]|jgi:starch synthase|nr:glycogen synthase [Ruminococcus sp.]